MQAGDFVPPMLAITAPRPFSRAGWWFETKWDGYRAIVSIGQQFQVYSRRGHNLALWYPALEQAQADLPQDIVLDGELVAWVKGRPQFQALQQRIPAAYLLMLFDCLYSEGRWLIHHPLEVRQRVLRERVQTQGMVVVSEGVAAEGEAMFEAVQETGLEGVMAKRLDSLYLPGRRSAHWQKFLAYRTEWFWAAAFSRAEDGSCYWLVAEQLEGRLRQAGRVRAPAGWDPPGGSGSAAMLDPPYWVEVQYRERTREGHLRHARIRQWRNTGHSEHPENPAP